MMGQQAMLRMAWVVESKTVSYLPDTLTDDYLGSPATAPPSHMNSVGIRHL